MVNRREPNDCVVTALANYTNKTYDEVYVLLERLRAPYEGTPNGYCKSTYLFALTCLLGRELHSVSPIPVNGILRLNNTIGLTMGHVVAVKDGMILDGSAFGYPYTPESYRQAFPFLVECEAWQ